MTAAGGVPPAQMESAFWWEYFREDKTLANDFPSGGTIVQQRVIKYRNHVADLFRSRVPEQLSGQIPWLNLEAEDRDFICSNLPVASFPAEVQSPSAETKHLDSLGLTRLNIWVDWAFTDEQIAEAVSSRLAAYRPLSKTTRKRRAKVRKDVQREATFAHPWCPDHESGLKWLGVLRVCRATDYNMEDVHQRYMFREEGTEMRRQAKWAEDIIEWMRSGDARRLRTQPKARDAAKKLKELCPPDDRLKGKKHIVFSIEDGKVLGMGHNFESDEDEIKALRHLMQDLGPLS
jgi:hypothetical protein